MAITIQNTPGTFYSVHGDLIFTVIDIVKANDPVTYPDYRYIADLYVDTTLVARLKAYPNPENKMGIFNISNILRNYIAATFNPSNTAINAQALGLGEFLINATVKFGEEYNFVLYTNITVDSERTYFNHYNGRLIGQNTTLSDYLNKPTTIRSLTTPVSEGAAFMFLPFLQDATGITISIKSYTLSGTHVGTLPIFTGSISDQILRIFNFSPAALNLSSPGFINPAVIGYYTVEFNADGNIYRFNLTCENRYEVFTLHFLNRFGGFESRDFTKVSRKTIDIEKQEFGKLGYTMDSSGVISYYNSNKVYNETRSIYSSQYKEKLVLNTDILTDDEYKWLADLILSPMVFVEIDGYFIPCAITDNNYEIRKAINDKLTNLTINIEFGEQFNAQYR